MPKALKIILAAVIGLPLCCCIFPYGCLYLKTPTTYEYQSVQNPGETAVRDESIPGIRILVRPFGEKFYLRTHTGPAYLQVWVYQTTLNLDASVRFLGAEGHSSVSGPFTVLGYGALPHPMKFEANRDGIPSTHIRGGQLFELDPATGERITFTVHLEFTIDDVVTRYSHDYEFEPKRFHEPLRRALPRR